MREHYTEALVLNKESLGEFDSKIFFYTRSLGRISAKVKSGRKITSKLTPHLEPLNLVKLRIIEKYGFQIADALKYDRLPIEQLNVLRLVNELNFNNHPDLDLWHIISRGGASTRDVLRILGFDPGFARCEQCGRDNPVYFYYRDSVYVCASCLPSQVSLESYFKVA